MKLSELIALLQGTLLSNVDHDVRFVAADFGVDDAEVKTITESRVCSLGHEHMEVFCELARAQGIADLYAYTSVYGFQAITAGALLSTWDHVFVIFDGYPVNT